MRPRKTVRTIEKLLCLSLSASLHLIFDLIMRVSTFYESFAVNSFFRHQETKTWKET
jgi:hypothetical protein